MKLLTSSVFVLAILKRRVGIVEIIHGSAVTIQALHSDVILHVPDGVYGIILGNIHTDHWRFRHLVPENDCIISPICNFYWKDSDIKSATKFKLQVCHIFQNIYTIADKIKVIRRENGESITAKYFTPKQDPSMVYYNFNHRYIDILTPNFSKFFVTAEGLECCASSMTVVSFAKMRNSESGPVANVVAHFGSAHYIYQGYREVRYLS